MSLTHYNIASKLSKLWELSRTHKFDIKKHQIHGIEWAIQREYVEKHKGGIFADEMGLGKTLQMLMTVVCNDTNSDGCYGDNKTLIILPLPLIEQWIDAIKKITNTNPYIYHPLYKNEVYEDNPITITSYGLLGKQKSFIIEKKWKRVIFDESHHIKNRKTSCFMGCKELISEIFWFISGTPIQNTIKDVYGPLQLLKYELISIKRKLERKEILKLCLLKRSKKSVGLKLPKMNKHDIYIDWENNDEEKIAKSAHIRAELINMRENNENLYEVTGSEKRIVRLLRAKQSCINTNMVPITNSLDKVKISTKIEKVYNTIKEVGFTKPKLIFCQFHSEIDMLYDSLSKDIEQHDLTMEKFDGRTTIEKRREILQNSPHILILQIQCGCEGLNLQQYKEVYFISPHWNPAIEDQAIARCHRIGQNEVVNVYKFYMNKLYDSDSVDLYIKYIQDRKREEYI